MLKEQFNALNESQMELYVKLKEAGFKATEDVFNVAIDMYGKLGEFIETVEGEHDDFDNVQLPNIEGLFEGHPVNDYVTASIQFALNGGKDSEKAMFEAASRLSAYQQGFDEKPVEKKETLDEYIERVTAALDVTDGTYAELFKQGLKVAIDTVEQRGGHSEFIVMTKTENKRARLYVNSETVRIVHGPEEYIFDRTVEEEPVEEECGFCCDLTNCCSTEEESEPISLYDYIQFVDSEYSEEVNANLQAIEDHMDGREIWGDEEYDLVRYYLKHLPNNSDYDIDGLRNRAVFLAWQKHQYMRTLK